MIFTTENRRALWQTCDRPIKKKIDANLQRDLQHGWLFPYLVGIDSLFWGRWQYWARCQSMPIHALSRWQIEPTLAILGTRQAEPLPKFVISETLPDEPIPQISWQYHDDALKMLNHALDCIPEYGEWLTMSSSTYLRYFIDWLLFGFGHPAIPELPAEPMGCKGASMRLYQVLDLGYLLYYPEDYLGRIVALSYGKRSQQANGFFPTPICLSHFMAEIVSLEDHKLARSETCNDPCVGTGSLLLAISNYRLCGIGQDIDELLLKCALVQFYLYAPWFAIPIWWIGWSDLLLGDCLSSEKPISLNAQYWYQEWFRNNTLDLVSYTMPQARFAHAPSELTEVEQNINISVEPSENAEVSSKSHFVNPKVPAIKQLSLFDL